MIGRFKNRSHKPERLDTGDYTPAEYAKWQREITWIHRIFGERRALRGSLLRELKNGPTEHFSVLEVGAGSGELLRSVRREIGNKNTLLVGSDVNADAAISIKNSSKSDEILAVQCDALCLPFADNSFDYIFGSLFLHHLTDEQSVSLLNEMTRVARRGFFVIDLHRHPVAYYFFRAFSPLFFQRFTQKEGALSILKSFRPAELRDLVKNAGFKNVSVKRSAAFRLVLSGKII